MAKEIDHGAGAYLFEHFLALICGGAVEGKSKTDQNKMGATDFTMANGQKGSAKYYGKGQNLTQAARGFEKGTTTYVVALKKQGIEQIGKTSRGTSDPDRLIAVELYFFDVVRTRSPGASSKGNYALTINGDPVALTSKTKNDDNPTVNLTKYVQGSGDVLYLAEVYTQTFREMVGKAIEKTSKSEKIKLKTAFALMQRMYDDLTNAEQKSKVYIAETDPSKRIAAGESTLQSLDTSKQSFGEIINALEYQETYDIKTDTIKKESNSIDQLIEAVMKGMLNETK
jgi:hypothetical protein